MNSPHMNFLFLSFKSQLHRK